MDGSDSGDKEGNDDDDGAIDGGVVADGRDDGDKDDDGGDDGGLLG